MKITLENQSDSHPLKVTLDTDSWDDSLEDSFDLCMSGLVAMGFHHESIKDIICGKAIQYDLDEQFNETMKKEKKNA